MCLNWGDIPTWLSAIATGLGIFFLWKQLDGLNKQAKLQVYAEYTKRYAEIVQRFPEDINTTDFVMSSRGKEQEGIMRAMRAYFDLCFEEWDLNEKGLISKDFWITWREGMSTALSKPAFKQAWALIQVDSVFGTKFVNFVSEMSQKR